MTDPITDTLSVPLGFSSLGDILFPGDRIVLVPDAETAAEPEILAKIVALMLKFGAEPSWISILSAESEERLVQEKLDPLVRKGVSIIVHRPEQQGRLALLGVDVDDRPIALNRELVDADMILTVGRYLPKKTAARQRNHFGIHTAIYPRFSDRETMLRFSEARGSKRRNLQAEVEEAARQLGVMFTVQWLRRRGRPDFIAAGLPERVVAELEKQAGS